MEPTAKFQERDQSVQLQRALCESWSRSL